MADDTESRWRGKLLPVREQGRALEKREDTKPAVASRISRSPLFNRWATKRVESAQDVVEAERKLMEALSEHTHAKHRLIHIDVEVQTVQAERLNRLRQAEADGNLMQLDVEIALAERELALLKWKQALREAQEGNARSSSKYDQKLQEVRRKMEFDAQMKVLDAERGLHTREQLKRAWEEKRAAVLRNVKDEPTAEQQWELDNIDDYYQKAIDEA